MPTPQDCPATLQITVVPGALPLFASLLQHGILCPVPGEVDLASFLLSLPGFTRDYLEQTVQTIFLDGVAADNLDQEIVGGSVVALSAAMPGLAGAIFRRHGLHGSLRSRPVHQHHPESKSGYVTIKLFNSIATDRIKDLLEGPVLMLGPVFRSFAGSRAHLFQPEVCRCLFNGVALDYPTLMAAAASSPVLSIQMKARGDALAEPGNPQLTTV